MSHDAHATHDSHASDAHDTVTSYGSPQEYLEPSIEENLPVGYTKSFVAYIWPLALSLVVTGLLIFVLFFAQISPPKAEEHKPEGLNTVTLTATAEPSAVVLSNPTPTAAAVAAFGRTPTVAPTDTLVAATPTVGIVNTPTLGSTIASPPVSLQIGSSNFRVDAAQTVSPTWQYDAAATTVASWLPNTFAPFIVGIPYSTANAGLLDGLNVGGQLTMQNAAGFSTTFQVSDKQRVAADSISTATVAPPASGLIIYLLGDPAATRLRLTAAPLPGQ